MDTPGGVQTVAIVNESGLWYKIATGVEITAGTEQAGTQREKPQEKRGRRAATV